MGVGVGGTGNLQAEEFVLRIYSNGTGSSKAVKLDSPRITQRIHSYFNSIGVNGPANMLQGVNG